MIYFENLQYLTDPAIVEILCAKGINVNQRVADGNCLVKRIIDEE